MKLLLSRGNFREECLNIWEASRGPLATLLSADGSRHKVDLFKLSVLSRLVMDVKNSLEVPESLSHLLEMDIILPDFSANIVNILCAMVDNVNTGVVTNVESFNELKKLVGVLSFTFNLSLMEDESSDNNNEIKVEIYITNDDNNEAKVDGLVENDNLELNEEFSEDIGGIPSELPVIETECVNESFDKNTSEFDPSRNKEITLDFRKQRREVSEKYVTAGLDGVAKIWKCSLCENYQSPKKETTFKHIDNVHISDFLDVTRLMVDQKTGQHTPLDISEELRKIIGSKEGEQMSWLQVVRKVGAYIEKKNLTDPGNKQWFTPDKTMEPIFGCKKIKKYSVGKYLKKHLSNK